MKPEELAIQHSQIIDNKLTAINGSFVAVKNEVNAKLEKLFTGLLVDNNGICINCKENKVLVGKAITLIKRRLKNQRPVIKGLYQDGTNQIEQLATNYINWLNESKS